MSILDDLQENGNRIVELEITPDKTLIEITEACDSWFSVSMTKAQFGQWIEELQALHAQMIERPKFTTGDSQ